MKEKVIVDGYSVIKNWSIFKNDIEKDIEVARRRLLRLMGDYHKRSGVKVTVVFDISDPDAKKVKKGSWNGVKIVFTSAERSSNVLIKSMIKSITERSLIGVASADEALNREVSELGARVIGEDIFLNLKSQVRSNRNRPSHDRNRSGPSSPLSDFLDEKTIRALRRLSSSN